MLAERGELDSPHGRQTVGVLLFQDLAVVPLLVLIPALAQPAGALGIEVSAALAKAALALALVVLVRSATVCAAGSAPSPAWDRPSSSCSTCWLIILLLAFLTGLAGLSLVLGAFLAGMLISETEYRFQVEEDIKPYRDVLLGLFFISVGMLLDVRLIAAHAGLVAALFAVLVAGKLALVAALSKAFGTSTGTALRVALALAQAGEFSFVLLPLAVAASLVTGRSGAGAAGAMILSMLAAPFLITASDAIVMRVSRSEWMLRSSSCIGVAAQSIRVERHVVVLVMAATASAWRGCSMPRACARRARSRPSAVRERRLPGKTWSLRQLTPRGVDRPRASRGPPRRFVTFADIHAAFASSRTSMPSTHRFPSSCGRATKPTSAASRRRARRRWCPKRSSRCDARFATLGRGGRAAQAA